MTDLDEIATLIAAGKKIHAIKALRELMGVGLLEAKNAVDEFEALGRWPADVHVGRPQVEREPTRPKGHLLHAVEQLAAQGNLIAAIKELRALTGLGLKESKQSVDDYNALGRWDATVLEAIGESSAAARPPVAATAGAPAVEQDSLARVLAAHLGDAARIHLRVPAQRGGHEGELVMLRDRACFVRGHRAQRQVDWVTGYDAVTHLEIEDAAGTVLEIHVGPVQERFVLSATDAEAALALFRVFG